MGRGRDVEPMRFHPPLDNHPIVHTSDFDEMCEVIWSATHQHPITLLSPPGPVDAMINGRMLGPISVSYMTFGAPVRTSPGLLEFFLVQVVLSGTYAVRHAGMDAVLSKGDAVVLSALEDVAETQWSSDCGVLTYQVGYGTYMDHLREEFRVLPPEPLRFAFHMDIRNGFGRQFCRDYLTGLTARLNRPSRLLDRPNRANQVVQQFLNTFLVVQPNNYRSDRRTAR
jgi:hypothetical protein